MPNDITNRITLVNATEQDIKSFKERYFNDKEEFDFEKVIATPLELLATKESSKTPKAVYDNNKRKYGYRSWYDWRVDNWGTKWNSYDNEGWQGNSFKFITAWSCPFEIVMELSKQNPHLHFQIEFADEFIGEYVGVYEFKNGEAIRQDRYPDGSKEAYELAFELDECAENYYQYNDTIGTYELK